MRLRIAHSCSTVSWYLSIAALQPLDHLEQPRMSRLPLGLTRENLMALRGQRVGRATMPARSPMRASIAYAAFAGVALVAAACSTTKAQTTASTTARAASPSGATSTTAVATAAAGCTLPLTHDALDGFHVGVPSGWDLFAFNSTIVVSKDPSLNTEETNVTPVLMTPGLTASSVFTSSLSVLQKQLAALGGTMTDVITNAVGQSPAASLTVQAGQVSLAGEARLAVLPQATAHGSSVAALVASWAPVADFAAERNTLSGIGACYGPEPGTLYQVVRDQVFTYAIPVGWTVKSEQQDTIEIDDGNVASVSYLLTMLQPGTGVNSAQSMLSYVFAHDGIHIDKQLSSVQSPDQQLPNGGTQGEVQVEFIGTRNGAAIHGSVKVVSATGDGDTPGGVVRLGVATPEMWNSLNGALTHVRESIQHDITQDLQQWESLRRQAQMFNQQVQGFDYALNGVDLVHDQATGATFEAPYSSYSATGPHGPGYYDKAGNRLQVQTP